MTAAVTIPCRQDPDAWDLHESQGTTITPAVGEAAVRATAGCSICPLIKSCKANRPATWDYRNVQAGEVYEPDRGWLPVDVWMRLAGLRRCRWCGDLTRNETYCGRSCIAKANPKFTAKKQAPAIKNPHRTVEGCVSTTVHDTDWAYRNRGCRCPKAVAQHQALEDRRIAMVNQRATEVAELTNLGLSAQQIARRLNVTPHTVHNYRVRARQVVA